MKQKLRGTKERPRLSVFRSNRYIYAQIIDDSRGITLAAAGSAGVEIKNKTQMAQKVGELIAQKAVKQKISQVVFDRGVRRFQGRIKALAEAARAQGLKF
ncbi:MAG: 50S ribosomal protein L18 [Candidatus Chisholmbacteria bacterium]|nr:50S ribosomal protein L18 [Candidatus Chisholmbacteria bacterium]